MNETYAVDIFTPIVVALDDDLNGDVWAVLLKELTEHLALKQYVRDSIEGLTSGKNG